MSTSPLLKNIGSGMAPGRAKGLSLVSGRESGGSGPSRPKRVYRFGAYRLDREARLLLRGKEQVSIPPKAFDILLALVENGGRVLGKDELMQMVWPDTFVEPSNLSVNIFLLRKALGARPDGGQYIETVPRRGYRFSSPITEATGASNKAFAVLEGGDQRAILDEIIGKGKGSVLTAHDALRAARGRGSVMLLVIMIEPGDLVERV